MQLTDRWLVGLAAIAVGATSAVYASAGALIVSVPALGLIAGAAAFLWTRDRQRALVLAVIGVALVPILLGFSLATPALGLVGLVFVVWRRPEWRRLAGRAPARVWVAGAVTVVVVAAFALWWHQAFIAAPEGGFSWSRPRLPVEGLPLVLAALALAGAVNSLFEELLWRVAFVGLPGTNAIGTAAWPLLVSAGFGLSHLHGTPGGWIGVAATFCFAIAMVWLRRRAGGTIVVCVVTHFVADLILLWGLYG